MRTLAEEAIDRPAEVAAKLKGQLEELLVVSDQQMSEEGEPSLPGREETERQPTSKKKRTLRRGARRPTRTENKSAGGREGKKPLARLPKWDEDKKIRCVRKNPKVEGKPSYDRYEKYKEARTVREYHQLGGSKADLRWDRRKGYVCAKKPVAADRAFEASVAEHLATGAEGEPPELLEARRRYAQQAKAFHAERAAAGVELPEELPYSVKMLPFWDKAAELEPELDKRLERIKACAQEAAAWCVTHQHDAGAAGGHGPRARGDGEAHGAVDEKAEAARQVEGFRALAEGVFVAATTEFEALICEALRHRRAVDVPTPTSYDDAMRGEFKACWQEALDSELENLKSHGVYVWVPRPAGVKVLDSNWAWRVKPADDGSVAKLKVRLVGRGFREIYGIHYHHTFAPVGKLATFRVMVSEIARRGMKITFLDIRSAYLKADAPVPKYMSVPKGVTPPKSGLVWLIKKALYGWRDSAAAWHKTFREDLLRWGFEPCASDACLFLKREGEAIMRVLLFVDDLAIAVDDTKEGQALEGWFKAKIKEKYEFSTSPDDNVYLGMTLEKTTDGHIVLTQRAYIERMMTTLGFEDCKKVWVPSSGDKVSIEDCPKEDPKDNPNGKSYREKCGMLRWIEQCTRPDISATLSELCKVQINPGGVHVKMMDHLCRYVSTTKGLGIVYGRHDPDRASGPLVMYVDSDWAGDPDTFYSRGGYQSMAWQVLVTWASYKMRAIANSSAHPS